MIAAIVFATFIRFSSCSTFGFSSFQLSFTSSLPSPVENPAPACRSSSSPKLSSCSSIGRKRGEPGYVLIRYSTNQFTYCRMVEEEKVTFTGTGFTARRNSATTRLGCSEVTRSGRLRIAKCSARTVCSSSVTFCSRCGCSDSAAVLKKGMLRAGIAISSFASGRRSRMRCSGPMTAA